MADGWKRIVIGDLRGGRNGYDPPLAIRENECADAVNVDWYQSTLAHRRNGSSASTMTFSAGGPFTGKISSLYRHVPGTAPTAAEQWAVDSALVVGRKAGATTFAAPTLKDALTGNGWDVDFASIQGKMPMAYASGQTRLHLWDGSTVLRAGLAATAAPTAANHATGGTYAATLRYYRQRVTTQVSSVTTRRSEPSPSVSFTPSGSKLAVTVTQASPPGEGETHWEVEVSLDNAVFYLLATVVIGTTTYDDSTVTTAYASGTLSASTGFYTLQKSYKYVAADQNRLLGFGSYTSTDKQSRIELSAVAGSSDISDCERVDTTTNWYIDLDENDTGVARGLEGPVFGNFYAFKDKQVWELTPTGSTFRPYKQSAVSKSVGAISRRAIVKGDDKDGFACLYFFSHRGPYRYGVRGLEYLGHGIEDLVLGPTSTINLAASNVVGHGLYHSDKRQVWFWFATGSSNDPDTLVMYDVMAGGWARFTGIPAGARCSAMLPSTLAATMSVTLPPYIGLAGTNNVFYKCDDSSVATDVGATTFQGYVTTKPIEPWGPGLYGETGDVLLTAKVATGVTVSVTVIPDYDSTLAKTGTALLTAVGSETRATRRAEDSRLSQATAMQFQIGDAAAASGAWTVDRIVVPATSEQGASA